MRIIAECMADCTGCAAGIDSLVGDVGSKLFFRSATSCALVLNIAPHAGDRARRIVRLGCRALRWRPFLCSPCRRVCGGILRRLLSRLDVSRFGASAYCRNLRYVCGDSASPRVCCTSRRMSPGSVFETFSYFRFSRLCMPICASLPGHSFQHIFCSIL